MTRIKVSNEIKELSLILLKSLSWAVPTLQLRSFDVSRLYQNSP
jgi:hypothetical protein